METSTNLSRWGFTANLSKRRLEDEEIINGQEAILYANRKDDRTLSYGLVAQDITERVKITKGTKILEICCGAGQLAHELYKITKSTNITATDGSRILIKHARERHAQDKITFESTALNNHSNKEKYDLVICKDSFHHFSHPIESMKAMLALTKKGGSIYIYDLCRECPTEEIQERLDTIDSENEGKRFLQSVNAAFTTSEMKDTAKKAGAKDFKCIYPIKFSKDNLKKNEEKIRHDKTKEHLLTKLSAVYLVKP